MPQPLPPEAVTTASHLGTRPFEKLPTASIGDNDQCHGEKEKRRSERQDTI